MNRIIKPNQQISKGTLDERLTGVEIMLHRSNQVLNYHSMALQGTDMLLEALFNKLGIDPREMLKDFKEKRAAQLAKEQAEKEKSEKPKTKKPKRKKKTARKKS